MIQSDNVAPNELFQVVKLLLERGADPRIRNRLGLDAKGIAASRVQQIQANPNSGFGDHQKLQEQQRMDELRRIIELL